MFIRGQNFRHKDGKTLQLSINKVVGKFVLFLTLVRDNTDGMIHLTIIKETHDTLDSCNKAYDFLANKLNEIYDVFGNELGNIEEK